jgi:signal transduction histidine kinase
VFYFWIKELYLEATKDELLHNIDILSLQVEHFKDFDKEAKGVKRLTGIRVTIIDQEGLVIGESDKDKATMDNHINRPEITQAKDESYGSSIRRSDTLGVKLFYVAREFEKNGRSYYIRMAKETKAINEQFYALALRTSLILIFFIGLLFVMTFRISREVGCETNKILTFLTNMMDQQKARTIRSSYSFEFDQMTKLLTKVSDALAKRNKQKSKYTARLKLSNRQKDEIISAISHEFKNPIAVISGYTETLLDEQDINEKIREKFLQKIHKSAENLNNLIDTLRLATKLDEGKQSFNYGRVDILKLAQEVIEGLEPKYKNREMNIKAAQSVIIKGDETLLHVALTNLVENGLKYSDTQVRIEIFQDRISVADDGIGIDHEEIANVTDKFYRVSNNHWDNSLGLGLSIVQNIVRLHNFELDIRSKIGEGSIFTIKFT